ncbi:MAG: histidine kinase [Acidobacteriota bacterium]
MQPAGASKSGERSGVRWWVVFGLWSIPALVEVNQRYLMESVDGEAVKWWRILVMAGFWYSWALLTPVIFELTRRAPIRPPQRWRHFALHLAFGVTMATVYVVVMSAFDLGGEGGAYGVRLVRNLAMGVPSLLMIYFVLVAVGMGLELRRRYREGELRQARLEQRLMTAQLSALRMQLQPHFLFNTLHAVSALMDEDVPAARRMIARLSELLRITLGSDGEPEVSLEREIEVLERYLDIERVRFGDRLQVDYEIDEAARSMLVPTLLLQPLVENSVRHAIAPHSRQGRIVIGARVESAKLKLSVADDGPGIQESPAEEEGIGLANTRARLEQRYGDAASFELQNGRDRGLEVRISLPLETCRSRPAARDRG